MNPDWFHQTLGEGRSVPTESLTEAMRLAVRGHVSELEIEPGSVAALVRPPRSRSELRARVGVRRLLDSEWEHLIELLVADPLAIGALRAGRLPADAQRLLPAMPGDLATDCPCGLPEPCGHALSVLALLDLAVRADPQVWCLLRGLDRSDLLRQVLEGSGRAPVTRPSGRPGAGARVLSTRPVDAGLPAGRALRRAATPLSPVALPVELRPSAPPHAAVAPPVDTGLDPAVLAALVDDLAHRARSLLAGTPGAAALDLDAVADVARRCAAGTAEPGAAAPRLGLDEATLESYAAAWRAGGAAALEVLREPRRPTDAELEAVRTAWCELTGGDPTTVAARSTGIRCGHGQIRRSSDGTWVRLVADEHLGWVVAAVAEEVAEVL